MSERTKNQNTRKWVRRAVKGVSMLAGAAMTGGALTACTPNTAPVPTAPVATKSAEAPATPKPATNESTPTIDAKEQNNLAIKKYLESPERNGVLNGFMA